MSRPTPTAEAQLEFLGRIERILAEGKFTTTYKFALLIAITNIAVEKGNDTGDELKIDLDEIARQFLSLYWSMARPYRGLNDMLRQVTNPAQQAIVLTLLNTVILQPGEGYARLLVYRDETLPHVARVRETIKRDVLYRLQSIGGGTTASADAFIYERPRDIDEARQLTELVLKPGAGACLRSLRGVVITLVQARWAQWVRKHNEELVAGGDLEAFMFGDTRTAVGMFAQPLYDLQHGRCFYSGARLCDEEPGEVDHFIPWSRYAFDSPFNLVLASRQVNQRKSDLLAPPAMRDRWQRRNDQHLTELTGVQFNAIHSDRETVHAIADWMYARQINLGSSPTYAPI